jgi:hypothetical protein
MTTRLLSSLRRVTLAAEHARNVDLAAPDENTKPETEPTRSDYTYIDPTENHRRLARGVPVLTRGVSGAITGTRPGDTL